MKVLAVETATSWQSVAVTEGDRVLALIEQDAEGSHTRLLMPAIDRVLREAGIGLRDLGGLAVSIGPGSFTGLRVGLATVLGFRAVLRIPVALVPTLEAMAWRRRDQLGRVVPVLKSRKNEVYWAVYEWLPGGTLQACSPEQVGSPQALGTVLAEVLPATVYGDGWLAYGAEVRQALGAHAERLQEANLPHPSAVAVAGAAVSRFERQDVAGSGIAPRYVQRTEAEIKFDQSQGLSALERRRERVASKLKRVGKPRTGRSGANPRAQK